MKNLFFCSAYFDRNSIRRLSNRTKRYSRNLFFFSIFFSVRKEEQCVFDETAILIKRISYTWSLKNVPCDANTGWEKKMFLLTMGELPVSVGYLDRTHTLRTWMYVIYVYVRTSATRSLHNRYFATSRERLYGRRYEGENEERQKMRSGTRNIRNARATAPFIPGSE